MAESSSPLDKVGPFTKLAGVKITRRENGYSQCIIEVNEQVLNNQNTVHGGAISTLVDAGMGSALDTRLKKDEMGRTLQLQINYFAAVSSDVLICESKIIHKGTRIATLESEVRNEGNLVAKATATYYVVKAKGD